MLMVAPLRESLPMNILRINYHCDVSVVLVKNGELDAARRKSAFAMSSRSPDFRRKRSAHVSTWPA